MILTKVERRSIIVPFGFFSVTKIKILLLRWHLIWLCAKVETSVLIRLSHLLVSAKIESKVGVRIRCARNPLLVAFLLHARLDFNWGDLFILWVFNSVLYPTS